MNHIITTKNGQGKQLKCLHCNGSAELKGGLIRLPNELSRFTQAHAHCQRTPKLSSLVNRIRRLNRLTAIISQLSEQDFDSVWIFVTKLRNNHADAPNGEVGAIG